ncbi:MAG: hypothetical protein IIA87_03610 [Nanoarchaeota archaeon]|nr:hypothetical protein [Nanoarchaeota archaeon]
MAGQVVIAGSGWGNQVRATSKGELVVTGSFVNTTGASALRQFDNTQINENILTELKRINTYMSLITDEEIKEDDII